MTFGDNMTELIGNKYMLNDITLYDSVDQIVAHMMAEHLAEKISYSDEGTDRSYWHLCTPGAFDKELIVVAVLGYPERVGVWSYTLLHQSRVDASSMEPYFRAFNHHQWCVVAINPNMPVPDSEGEAFVYQLEKVLSTIGPEQRIGLIGFSMGGRILVEFLEQRPELINRVMGLALIDPTLPNRLRVNRIRSLLDHNTLLIASEGDVMSPGKIASVLLDIPAVTFSGIHGEMPNKALNEVIDFYAERI